MLQVLPLYSSADWEWLVPACLTVVLRYVTVTLMVNQVQNLKNTTTTRANRKDLSRPYHFSGPPSDLQALFFISITISRKLEQCRKIVKPCMGCMTSMSLWPPGPLLPGFIYLVRHTRLKAFRAGMAVLQHCTSAFFAMFSITSLEDTLCLSQGAIRSEVRSQVLPLLGTGSLLFLHPFYMVFKGNQSFPERACIISGW